MKCWSACSLAVIAVISGARAQACAFLDPAAGVKFAAIAAECGEIALPPAEASVESVAESVPESLVPPAFSVAVPFASSRSPAVRRGARIGLAAAPRGVPDPLVRAIAHSYRIDPLLLAAIVARESAGRADAVSSKGARGLLQVMPATARGLGVADAALLADPRINLATGATYLKQMQARFGGDLALTLAAYNAGPGAVARHRGVPPYAETRAYVAAILSRYRAARAAGNADIAR